MSLSIDLFSINLSMFKTRLFIFIFTTLILRQGLIAQGLVINELVSDNTLGTVDEDGEVSDWVELYNASGEAVDVGGMGLSDEEGNEFKWVFPSREIEAWGYLVVFASGKDRIDGGELHANFSVGSEGEKLWLVGSEGEILDEVDEVELCDDKSYGRLPDGGVWNMLETPSFGNTNNLNDIVSSSYDGGYYNENIVVESFTNRYAQILSEDFNRSNLLNISFAVKELYEDEMEKNIRRWHYPSSYSNWESAFSSEIQDFFEERPCKVENNIIEFFDLETFEFDCNSEISFETLTVWPNPSDGNFTIQNNSLSTIRGDLSISNLAGVTVFFAADVHFNAFEALQIAHLDISQGMYILNINGLYFRKVVKIVIQ